MVRAWGEVADIENKGNQETQDGQTPWVVTCEVAFASPLYPACLRPSSLDAGDSITLCQLPRWRSNALAGRAGNLAPKPTRQNPLPLSPHPHHHPKPPVRARRPQLLKRYYLARLYHHSHCRRLPAIDLAERIAILVIEKPGSARKAGSPRVCRRTHDPSIPRMKSDTRSPITMDVAFVFARIQSGMIDASTIRSPSSA